MENAIDSKMFEGADILVSPLPSREPTSTPPKSAVDNNPSPQASCDGKAKNTVHFADELSITNIEFSDSIECDDQILGIDGDARSDRSIDQPTPEASDHTVPKATTHQPQRPIERKAKRQGEHTPL